MLVVQSLGCKISVCVLVKIQVGTSYHVLCIMYGCLGHASKAYVVLNVLLSNAKMSKRTHDMDT